MPLFGERGMVDHSIRKFLQQYAERKAAQATRQASMHITRENELLRVTKLWETRKAAALAQLSRAEALIIKVHDPERVAENAAQHNGAAVVWSDALPSAWLNFNVTEQQTDFYIADGKSGAEELERALDAAVSEVLPKTKKPNPLCVRMRDVRLHLTQTGRAYHLETSIDLEPHEVELECREHMHSWERHVAEYARIKKMASAATGSAKEQWNAWLKAKDPFVDPPTLAFEQYDIAPEALPKKSDFILMHHAIDYQYSNDNATITQIDLASDNEAYFLGTHATDAAAIYFEANTTSKFAGFVSTAFEADGKVLFAAVHKDVIKTTFSMFEDQAVLRFLFVMSYYDSTMVKKAVINARTEYGPESPCYAMTSEGQSKLHYILQPLPNYFMAKKMVISQIASYDIDDAEAVYNSTSVPRKASLLHAAGVVLEFQTRSTAFADARGLKLAKRKLRQLLHHITPFGQN